MRILATVWALLLAPGARAQGAARKITVVVEAGEPLKEAVLGRLAKTFSGTARLSVHEFERAALADPIRKGRLLAALQLGDLLVAVGDSATDLVFEELEDVSVYFVGSSLVDGKRLASPSLAGTLAYNLDGLLDAVGSLSSGKLGVAYTPGYESMAETILRGARSRGLAVLEKKISAPKEIPAAVRELVEQSQVIWIVGDPLLARGAGFRFLAERALSRRIPIVAAGDWEVRHGAFLTIEPPAEAVASQAADDVKSIAAGAALPASARVREAPTGGTIAFNGPLAEKWKLRVPTGASWRALR